MWPEKLKPMFADAKSKEIGLYLIGQASALKFAVLRIKYIYTYLVILLNV